MDRPELLLLVVVVTMAGSLLVGWSGVLLLNADPWLSEGVGYIAVAMVSLVLLLLLLGRARRKDEKLI